jgi:hypothetical protein
MIVIYNKSKKVIMTCSALENIKAYIEDNKLEYIESKENMDLVNFEYKIINGEIIKGDPTQKPEILE